MNKRLPEVALSELVQESSCVFDSLLPEDVMDKAPWVYTSKKNNYDKELLLDFIEWLSEKHNISLTKDIEMGFSERIVEYGWLGIVDQYLEDDE